MISFFNSLKLNTVRTKYFLVSLLILTSLFLAFNHHPPTMSKWEGAEIYKGFIPIKNPPLALIISEDPVLFSGLNTFGYASLMISRYISDYTGHTLSNIRLPSVIYGLIALFLFYVIVNRWFDWKVALISTFILATNQYFLMFQHLLLSPMVTLMTILFCIERFQNLLIKNNKFAILSFGFACALTTLHYWTGRWCMLCILLFYLVDFEKFSIWKLKSYLHFTNIQRIKTVLQVFITMIVILTIFFPGNVVLLFSYDFIYPSFRVGEYSDEVFKSFYNIWHNFVYYLKFYIFNRSSNSADLMAYIPYPIENLAIVIFSLLGIIISLIRKITYKTIFILYILFVTFFPLLLSETNVDVAYEASTSLSNHRVFFSIPFICIAAVFVMRDIYIYIIKKGYLSESFFVFLVVVFFCVRIYGYDAEIKKFNTNINSYKIDFSQPAIADGAKLSSYLDFQMRSEIEYNQIYYYRLANFISNRLKTVASKPDSTNLIYIPEDIYTPFHYELGGGMVPLKGFPYYFPMFLTIHLQQQDVNASYLVKKKILKKLF